jgi:hypothetical protein
MPTTSNEISKLWEISMVSMEKTIHILFSYLAIHHKIYGFTIFENAFDITD